MQRYYKSADAEWYKQRLNGVMLVVFAAFTVLITRLFYLQIIEGDEYRRLSDNNCIRLQNIDAPRGSIFDRKKRLLVDNRPSFDLSIVLKDAKPVEETIRKLANYTGIPEEELRNIVAEKKSHPYYRPFLLKRDIGRDALAAIKAHAYDLPGVVVDIRTVRNYIHERSAAHILGYMSEISPDELKSGRYPKNRQGDFIGKFGVEKTYEEILRGVRGGQQVEVDANGQVVRVLRTVDAVPGNNIVLTIDRDLQHKAEELLQGKTGAVVAVEPATGEVLAMASSPTFDQNEFVSGLSRDLWRELISNPKKPMSNKAIQAEYPPASTYKIVTAMAGLEEGVIDTDTTVNCPGYYYYGNRSFRCWKAGGHGPVNVFGALAKSCDVFFYQLGQKLGVDRLAWYARACGLGHLTRIDLDHESGGLIPSEVWKRKRFGVAWMGGETLSVAIGQGYNLTTPLQMAVLTAAVGLDGVRRKPLILRSVETVDGMTLDKNRVKILGRLPVSERTLQIIRKGLWEVVNMQYGTAWAAARLPDISVSGKTGTAQVFSRKSEDAVRDSKGRLPDHLKPHAWFVSYAPSENPRIAIAVMIENGEHGSSAAGPVARELIKLYLSE
ncbi:MAG: penicillin-binding protein 2 [Thermodesulfobacteriota bacterium]